MEWTTDHILTLQHSLEHYERMLSLAEKKKPTLKLAFASEMKWDEVVVLDTCWRVEMMVVKVEVMVINTSK